MRTIELGGGGGGALPDANVAMTALQDSKAPNVKLAEYEPVDDTCADSFAPGEPDAFCCSIVKPAPLVIEVVELDCSPTPAKINSFAEFVVAVGPAVAVVPVPCAAAVRSTCIVPVYS